MTTHSRPAMRAMTVRTPAPGDPRELPSNVTPQFTKVPRGKASLPSSRERLDPLRGRHLAFFVNPGGVRFPPAGAHLGNPCRELVIELLHAEAVLFSLGSGHDLVQGGSDGMQIDTSHHAPPIRSDSSEVMS